MSDLTITEYTPRVMVASSWASHHFKVSDLLAFADLLRQAVDEHGLNPRAAIDFGRSDSGHVVRLSATSGGDGERRVITEAVGS